MLEVVLFLALACIVAPAAPARDFDDVEIGTTDLGGGLYMLAGRGGNIALSVGTDGAFLIDDQFAPLTPKILEAVAKLTPEPIRFVLNTHWHGDHTGGNENLGKGGAVIVAHDGVRRRMAAGQLMEDFQREEPPAPAVALPKVTYGDAVTLHLNGQEVRASHVPAAHTDGDSIVLFREANVLHMGDVFFSGMYPYIDLASGGSVDGMIAAMQRGLEIADAATMIIPGHGALSGEAELRASMEMLDQVRSRVAAARAQGKSLEEVVASRPTADLDGHWEKGFVKADFFVGVVYRSLETAEN